jgi:hypothetical protein
MVLCRWLALFLLLASSSGFTPNSHLNRQGFATSSSTLSPAFSASPLFAQPKRQDSPSSNNNKDVEDSSSSPTTLWKRVSNRFDSVRSVDLKNVQIASIFQRILGLHNPKTYLALAAVAAFRNTSLFRNMFYWAAVAFCIKWYRARYVFKIPVWDRQPNWNNVITSKEQEKDLKALTCKTCGSTIFIAKSREFFFEGNTGLAGMGCFACGVKGKDNFVMDRDRIVEDIADIDDYFEYERPLDFVSAGERRKVLKDAGGDEEKANQMLLDRDQPQPPNGETTVEAKSEEVAAAETTTDSEESTEEVLSEVVESKPKVEEETPEVVDAVVEPVEEPPKEEMTKKQSKPNENKPKMQAKSQPKKVDPPTGDVDELGMDDF